MNQTDKNQEYEEDGSKFAVYETELPSEYIALVKEYGSEAFDDLTDHLTEEEREVLENKNAGR